MPGAKSRAADRQNDPVASLSCRPIATNQEFAMGRSYWFECPRCGYRAKISGRADRGFNFSVQTILCRDCKELYDAVTRVRTPVQAAVLRNVSRLGPAKSLNPQRTDARPPSFQSMLNRLPAAGVKRFRWLQFKLQCPVSPLHRIERWNEPDKCPRCGVYLEKHGLPFRIWE